MSLPSVWVTPCEAKGEAPSRSWTELCAGALATVMVKVMGWVGEAGLGEAMRLMAGVAGPATSSLRLPVLLSMPGEAGWKMATRVWVPAAR